MILFLSLPLSLFLAAMALATPAMADPPPPGSVATPSTSTATVGSAAAALPSSAPALPSSAPALPSSAPALPSSAPAVAPAPSAAEQAPQAFVPPVLPPQTAPHGVPWRPAVWLPPAAPTGLSYGTPAEPEPRRSPGKIAGGVTLVVFGAAGVVACPFLLGGAFISLFLPDRGKSAGTFALGALGSLAVGAVGLGVGIPLIRSGARKEVRDPPSATLWLGPGTLTGSF